MTSRETHLKMAHGLLRSVAEHTDPIERIALAAESLGHFAAAEAEGISIAKSKIEIRDANAKISRERLARSANRWQRPASPLI